MQKENYCRRSESRKKVRGVKVQYCKSESSSGDGHYSWISRSPGPFRGVLR